MRPDAVMPPPARTDIISDTAAAVGIDPFTIKTVSSRRAKAGKLNGGVAAKATSDCFKSIGEKLVQPNESTPTLISDIDVSDSRPRIKARRWDHILSNESKSRKPSSLKGTAKYLALPGLVSLCGGLPSSEYFPIDELALKVPNVPHFSERDTRANGKVLRAGKHDVVEGKGLYDLEIALNYGLGAGSPQMLRFVTEHVELVHRPPYQDWHCSLTIGNSSALDIAFRLFTKPGQYILMEEFTFSSAIETARPMGLHVVGIKMDGEGLVPAHMDEVLSGWDEQAHGGAKKPHLLYTVPCGQNPTGATAGAERRKEVYAVAQRHDVYILEDDPYYFLQMQPYRPDDDGIERSGVSPSHGDFLRGLLPSYLRLDTDGRVMRMDSFSKVLAPGLRTGFITASEQIVERVVRHQELSVQNPSGLAQLTLYKLLDEHWGHGGFLDWLVYLRGEYARRRDGMLRICEKYLPGGLVEWRAPAAGMFVSTPIVCSVLYRQGLYGFVFVVCVSLLSNLPPRVLSSGSKSSGKNILDISTTGVIRTTTAVMLAAMAQMDWRVASKLT